MVIQFCQKSCFSVAISHVRFLARVLDASDRKGGGEGGGGGGGKSGREKFGFISCFNEVDWPPQGEKVIDIRFSIPLVSNLLSLLKMETN